MGFFRRKLLQLGQNRTPKGAHHDNVTPAQMTKCSVSRPIQEGPVVLSRTSNIVNITRPNSVSTKGALLFLFQTIPGGRDLEFQSTSNCNLIKNRTLPKNLGSSLKSLLPAYHDTNRLRQRRPTLNSSHRIQAKRAHRVYFPSGNGRRLNKFACPEQGVTGCVPPERLHHQRLRFKPASWSLGRKPDFGAGGGSRDCT